MNIKIDKAEDNTFDLKFFDYRFEMHVTIMMDATDMLMLLAQIPEHFHKQNDERRKIRGKL